MKALPWIITVCAVTLAGHSWIHTSSEKAVLKETVNLTDQARKIDNDQIRDLMHELRDAHQISEAEKTRYFVMGVLDHMDRPEHYEAIWHDGYNRGTEVQKEADKVSEKTEEAYNPKDPKDKSEIEPLPKSEP